MRAILLLSLLTALAPRPAAATTMSCDPVPTNAKREREGAEVCRYDGDGPAKKRVGRTSLWKADKEVGPRKSFREEDGAIERIEHLVPNAGPFRSDERYYETGDLRRVELQGSDHAMIGIEYYVSGKIHRVWCQPGKSGGYSYTLAECQTRAPFDLAKWRPSK